MIEHLKAIDNNLLYYGDSNGYGPSGNIQLITREGVYGPVCLTESPYAMTNVEYNEALQLIRDGKRSEVDYKILDMIDGECKPNIKFYKDVYGGWYHEWDDFFINIFDFEHLVMWDEMDDKNIEKYYKFIISNAI